MAPTPTSVLAINGGSSSIKFAIYQTDCIIDALGIRKGGPDGLDGTTLSWHATKGDGRMDAPDDKPAPGLLVDWLETRQEFAAVKAVGHRVVHALTRTEPERITRAVLDELPMSSCSDVMKPIEPPRI